MFLDIHTANDVHFTIKDVAWLVGLIVSFGTAWFKLKLENAKQEEVFVFSKIAAFKGMLTILVRTFSICNLIALKILRGF